MDRKTPPFSSQSKESVLRDFASTHNRVLQRVGEDMLVVRFDAFDPPSVPRHALRVHVELVNDVIVMLGADLCWAVRDRSGVWHIDTDHPRSGLGFGSTRTRFFWREDRLDYCESAVLSVEPFDARDIRLAILGFALMSEAA